MVISCKNDYPILSKEINQTWVFIDSKTNRTDTLIIRIDPLKYTKQQYIDTYTKAYYRWLSNTSNRVKETIDSI